MSIARTRSPFTYLYSLCGQVLSSVPEARYLGIMVTDELSCHGLPMSSLYIVKQILLSVSSVAICDDALPNSRSLISLVRSTLEYTASVWDPHLAKDINNLENIQRRSARFVKGDYRMTSSVMQMLQELGCQDLQSRRCDLRLQSGYGSCWYPA